ncbi:MAG: hypothetical protein OCC45_09365 [Desulfotalea sp.]
MNTIKSLYFPGTAIYSAKQYPLFLLPIKLYLLQPVEDMPLAGQEDVHDSFIKNDYCQGYTPCPLGENRERFVQLVNDIKHRKDDYASQLSQLTLAAMSAPKKDKSESKHGIISSLIGKDIIKEDEGAADIWQARLTLALAEMVDIEEDDLSRNMSILDDYQSDLFNELQGEVDEDDESPFADLLQQQRSASATGNTHNNHRIDAWHKLYDSSSTEIKEIRLFITDNKDAAEHIIDSFHDLSGKSHEPALSVEIPAITGWEDIKVLEEIANFRKDNDELLDNLAGLLQGISTDQEIADNWHKAIDSAYPTESFGRHEADVYHLPHTPFNNSQDSCCLIYIKG